ncbi:MAG: cation:proton antiporter subunit C [Dehalococcoidia bacterium]
MIEEIGARFPYWGIALILIVGLYGMIIKRDLVKKVIGLVIFQAAIVIFFVSGSIRSGGDVPILYSAGAPQPEFMNPLPQVLMLTAIVVTVATVGVALAFLVKIYQEFGELDEEFLLKQVRE